MTDPDRPRMLPELDHGKAPRRYWEPGIISLPEWWAQGSNQYFCGLIARQLRCRADCHRRAGDHLEAAEADAIAAIVEAGEFDWLK